MKARFLIIAAALAATAVTTMAQPVTNIPSHGYLQVPVVEGFNLLANPLDYDGTGLNNTPANIFSSNLPVNSTIYGWAAGGGGYNIAIYARDLFMPVPEWLLAAGTMPTLDVGQGFWLSIPGGGLAGTSSNVTFAGEILQGVLVNTNLSAGNPAGGFGLVGSMVAKAGLLTADLNYHPFVGDTTYQWNTTPGVGYTIHNYVHNLIVGGQGWRLVAGPPGPAEPTIGVGEGFWLNSGPVSFWSNYFIVQ